MPRLRPLPLRLIDEHWTDRVPAPAAETLSPAERQAHVAANPLSYLGVTRALDEGSDDPATVAGTLTASRDHLDVLLDRGAFGPVRRPAVYLYRLTIGDHAQTGIVAGLPIEAYDRGEVAIHEQVKTVRAGYLADHREAVRVESSPISVAHPPDRDLASQVDHLATEAEPVVDFTADDGLRQTVWAVDDAAGAELLDRLADHRLYLIDGHHRAAAASIGAERSAGRDGDILTVVFAADRLHNSAFHRSLNGVDVEALITTIGRRYPIRPATSADDLADRRPGELALVAGGTPLVVTVASDGVGLAEDDRAGVDGLGGLDGLDPVLLQRRILEPLLGIDETVPTPRLTYRIGDGDRADIETLDVADDAAVWVMRPVPVATILTTADAGRVMPPKSTCFLPKVRSGVFLRHLP